MQHGVAPTLTDTPVAFTLKNIVAFTLNIPLHPLETYTARLTIKKTAHISAGFISQILFSYCSEPSFFFAMDAAKITIAPSE